MKGRCLSEKTIDQCLCFVLFSWSLVGVKGLNLSSHWPIRILWSNALLCREN